MVPSPQEEENEMSDRIVQARWLVRGVENRNKADIVDDGAVLVREGRVAGTGSLDDMRRLAPQAPVTRHATHMLLPGFVNSHHHVGLTPLQLGSPDHALELWFASRIPARRIDVYLDTLYSAFEMLASGITTVQHIQGWMPGPLDNIHRIAGRTMQAYRDLGMRASYCFAVREQNRLVYEADEAFCARLPTDLGARLAAYLKAQAIPFADHLTLFDRLSEDNAGQRLTRVQLAPANLHWVSDDGLQALQEKSAATGAPMHMHLLETMFQKEYARRRTGTTAVKHLERLGLLGPHLTLGHGVWMTEEDIEIAAATGTCICHNCSSNFRLRSGVLPLNRLEAKGVTVGLGLDEAGINDDRDMLQELRLVLRVHREPGMDPDDVPTCPQVLRMATEHGGDTTAFKGEIGRLAPGRFFDAVAIDYGKATYPYQDADIPPLDALMQRARTDAVACVYVDGEAVYENGRFARIDRDAVLKEIAELLSRPRSPEELANRELGFAVFPHVEAFYRGYVEGQERRPFYAPSSRV
jgi:5-methylthioadenosine/S-adenosylhomocysteine deaminase